jgi:phospholipid/cholesterol/gamma-HCH transport system ATP-binding protein
MLRLMIGNVRPTAATSIALGENLCQMTPPELATYRKSIGVLFQSGALFNSMTVAENVALPLREHSDLPRETIEIVVKIKLELVGLREHADKMPSQLSGGMKKRAGSRGRSRWTRRSCSTTSPSAGLDPVTSAEIDRADHRPEQEAGRDQRRRHARDGLRLPHRRPHGAASTAESSSSPAPLTR